MVAREAQPFIARMIVVILLPVGRPDAFAAQRRWGLAGGMGSVIVSNGVCAAKLICPSGKSVDFFRTTLGSSGPNPEEIACA